MALTLTLVDEDGTPVGDSFVLLDEELLEYLGGLSEYPALQRLGRLDPERDTRLGAKARAALAGEIEALAPLARRREVAAPPDWVGLEGTGDIRLGEEFGWRGLLDFLQRVEHLLHLSQSLGVGLWALAED